MLGQQCPVFVFKINDEQQPKQQHDAVFINAGQRRAGAGLVNGTAHDFKQRVFARVAVNHRLEVFFDGQRELGGGGNGFLNRAGRAALRRAQVSRLAEEEGEQGEGAGFFVGLRQGADFFEVELDKGLFGGDFVRVIDAPDAPVGQKTIAHAQGA